MTVRFSYYDIQLAVYHKKWFPLWARVIADY
jgi:hypothetical protein